MGPFIMKGVILYLISITDCIANSQLQLDVGLFQLVGVGLQPDGRLLVVASVALKVRVEQGVHQSGLAQSGLADAHDVEGEPALDRLVDQLDRKKIVGKQNFN